MIQSTSYLVCFGKRERNKKTKKTREKKEKEVSEKKREKKSVKKKKQNPDLSRLILVVEFGLESILCTVQ